ncbi:FAD-dependent oxidoreductase [Nocardioides ginsengisoli]|uniref:NAD(P)/FAD-dependent oxidoreductase n=1 Tax=Nocardioides ginsengisoli TaxID=363868 RepID=A0ABW3VYN3_9ACTN
MTVSSTPFWLDSPDRPAARPRLDGDATCALAVVGGGYSGLWTALMAKEREPGRSVILIEADRIGGAASGRNGGFCEASLTHGEANGRTRWPEEADRLEELGLANLDEIEKTLRNHGIECDFRRTGQLAVATQPHQVEELRAGADGEHAVFLDAAAVRAEVDSPTYLSGLWSKDTCATVDPARLAWGLAAAAERLGVRIVEGTPVERIRRTGAGIDLHTPHGTVHAGQVALGTNAFRPLLRRLRLHTVPVYDYVLMTEPLTDEQLASIGWRNRQGLADCGNQFHYYRLTADNRILWGGYDAIYHFGRRPKPSYEQRPATFDVLARHFRETFPQLAGVGFTHRWGGVIDTSTRFCAFFGKAYRGRVAYALGYTGLGVGASRFGADVMLDLLAGEETERTRLAMVREKPLPFPPEPLAWVGIQLTRWSLARADARGGRRNLWLRVLDRLGLGFDS